MRFADPIVLILLPLLAGYLWLQRSRAGRAPRAYVAFPPLALLDGVGGGGRARWAALLPALRAATATLLIVALARPQGAKDVRDVHLRGRNIVLALDISSSMKAVDFRPGNRLEVSKRVLADFVRARKGDFLGLVVFASRALTQVPLTNDTGVLNEMLARVDIGLLPDGTAIGTALAMSADRLKDLPRASCAIVLITDGGNNTGSPDPLTAANIARALGIRVYTIGVSAHDSSSDANRDTAHAASGLAYSETPSALSARDEDVLRRIASITGGRYYRATDPGVLAGVMANIDRLEKTELHLRDVRSYREYYAWVLLPALIALGLDLALGAMWLRTLP
ncbi:MAG TPA: VWA domain-containing protein [Gemmatimonadaceae bacterium]|jgi:Ca-activated chloride channel family protein